MPFDPITVSPTIAADAAAIDAAVDKLVSDVPAPVPAGVAPAAAQVKADVVALVNATSPPLPKLTISNLTAIATGTSVAMSVDCSPDIENVAFHAGTVRVGQVTPVNGVAALTTTLAAGTYTIKAQGWDTPPGGGGPSTAILSTTVVVGPPPPPPPAAPVNVTAPVINGTPQVGATLTATPGTWTNSPTSEAYLWSTGATGVTYVPVAADLGTDLTVAVTASNAAGSSAPAVSASVLVVPAPPPPPPGGATVNAAPTGPAVPAGGWSVILADAFGKQGNYTALSDLWYPNRNSSSNNVGGGSLPLSNEKPWANSPQGLTAHNASQVSITADGLVLACEHVSPAQNGYNYISGSIMSANSAVAAHGGSIYAPQSPGFSWSPNKSVGATWAFEILATFPSNAGGGADPGWWTTDGPWAIEIDFIEYWGWEGGTDGGLTTLLSWINNGSQAVSQNKGFQPFVQDGKQHRITHVFSDAAGTIDCWLDGVSLGKVASYPSSWSSNPMGLIASYEMRGAATFTDTRYWTIRSIAVYVDTDHKGSANFTGGGIASGTSVG